MMNKFKVEPDIPLQEKKLSAIVAEIEAILKPCQSNLAVTVEKANGIPSTIRITATINLR